MSSIFYYSKYCDVSNKYLQLLSKTTVQKDVHFICIDKRTKDSNNKTYIILENGQQILDGGDTLTIEKIFQEEKLILMKKKSDFKKNGRRTLFEYK